MSLNMFQTVGTATKTRRPLLLAAVIAGVVLVSGTGSVGLGPSAQAEPNDGGEWDIQTYDNCLDEWAINNPGGPPLPPQSVQQGCCAKSGGVWVIHGPSGKCEAQPAAATSTPAPPLPGATVMPPGSNTRLGTQ
jgi:hypothetical protein